MPTTSDVSSGDGSAIQFALLRKSLDAQEAEGKAVVALIKAAADVGHTAAGAVAPSERGGLDVNG